MAQLRSIEQICNLQIKRPNLELIAWSIMRAERERGRERVGPDPLTSPWR